MHNLRRTIQLSGIFILRYLKRKSSVPLELVAPPAAAAQPRANPSTGPPRLPSTDPTLASSYPHPSRLDGTPHARGWSGRNESLAAERERRQHMRSDVSEHAGAFIRCERYARDGRCDARREPRRKVRQRLYPDVCRVSHIERLERGTDDGVVPRRRCVAEDAQFVAERTPHGASTTLLTARRADHRACMRRSSSR